MYTYLYFIEDKVERFSCTSQSEKAWNFASVGHVMDTFGPISGVLIISSLIGYIILCALGPL